MGLWVRAVVAGSLVLAVAAAPASATRAKGEGPVALAAGYGSLWIGLGNGDVLRVDPRTRRVTRVFDYDGCCGFVHGLAAAYGSIWLADGLFVTRLDPR